MCPVYERYRSGAAVTCTARARVRALELGDALGVVECVLGGDVLAPDIDPHAGWTIETTLSQATVPPAVLRVVERHGGEVVDVSARGEPPRAMVLAAV